MTHNYKHSNSKGAHGLVNWLFPSQTNWSSVKQPSAAAEKREKITTDAADVATASQFQSICVENARVFWSLFIKGQCHLRENPNMDN